MYIRIIIKSKQFQIIQHGWKILIQHFIHCIIIPRHAVFSPWPPAPSCAWGCCEGSDCFAWEPSRCCRFPDQLSWRCMQWPPVVCDHHHHPPWHLLHSWQLEGLASLRTSAAASFQRQFLFLSIRQFLKKCPSRLGNVKAFKNPLGN